jgi:hypothetical protein
VKNSFRREATLGTSANGPPQLDSMGATTNPTPGEIDSPSLLRSPGAARVAGHEALQALLAFSALNEQIRKRRLAGISDKDTYDQFALDEVLQLVAERALAMT